MNMASPYKSPWVFSTDADGYVLRKARQKRLSEVNLHNEISPFVSKDNILTVQVCVKKLDNRIVSNVSCGIAELHPDTMEFCTFGYGSAIILCKRLSTDNRSRIASFKVLPSVSPLISPGKIAMSQDAISQFGIEKDEFVYVCSSVSNTETVECVDLYSEDIDILKTSNMERYVATVLKSRYFVQNQVLMIEYLGKKCLFKIHSEVDKSEKHLEMADDRELTTTVADLKCMSLTEDAHSLSKINMLHLRSVKVYQMTENAEVRISQRPDSLQVNLLCDSVTHISFSDIGGLKQQVKQLKTFVELAVNEPKLFTESGLTPPTGIILHGPSGTGKTMLMECCSKNLKCPTVSIDIGRIASKQAIDAEEELLGCFNAAMKSPPTLILIDNIHVICPKKDIARNDLAKTLDFRLCNLLDRISSHNKLSHNYVIVLSATNNLESVSPMLRQSSRLECEIEIPTPSPSDRHEIFQKELKAYRNSLELSHVRSIAEKAHGYVGSDIAAACKEASKIAFDRYLANTSREFCLGLTDLEQALKRISPSAIRELIVQVPKVLWSDIGGNSEVKKKLKQTVEWPLNHPEAFQRLGIDAPSGVLLYGPPGCSKTLTAKALATESGLNFISVKGPELFSKYVGDSEKAIRKIFAKAKAASPSIIFIDELDVLAGERNSKSSTSNNMTDRVLATLLTELDGVETREDVIIVAATNRPDKIDKALLRPGRIDRIVYVPLPDVLTRRDIFQIRFRKTRVSASVDINWLVDRTDGYSGAEICAICREAGLSALERDINATVLEHSDFEVALSTVHPQTTKDVVQMYEQYASTFL